MGAGDRSHSYGQGGVSVQSLRPDVTVTEQHWDGDQASPAATLSGAVISRTRSRVRSGS